MPRTYFRIPKPDRMYVIKARSYADALHLADRLDDGDDEALRLMFDPVTEAEFVNTWPVEGEMR